MNSINQNPVQSQNSENLTQANKPIVLVGMMGVGKSTVGRRLAARLSIPFVDVDDEIIISANMDIADIFKKFGEDYFRQGERRVIRRLLDGKQKIIATGGGAFIQEETRQTIMEKAITIWLKADINILIKRVSKRNNRPLLFNRDPKKVLSELSEIRNPIYALAQHHINTGDSLHDQTVTKIIETLSK